MTLRRSLAAHCRCTAAQQELRQPDECIFIWVQNIWFYHIWTFGCILPISHFLGYASPWGKIILGEWNSIKVANATLHLFIQAVWGRIWKLILNKNRKNANNVTLHLSRQDKQEIFYGDSTHKIYVNSMRIQNICVLKRYMSMLIQKSKALTYLILIIWRSKFKKVRPYQIFKIWQIR